MPSWPTKRVNLAIHRTAQKLAARSVESLNKVHYVRLCTSRTLRSRRTHRSQPGKRSEKRLNRKYGRRDEYEEYFCKYIEQGLEDGWIVSGKVYSSKYRRGKGAGSVGYRCRRWLANATRSYSPRKRTSTCLSPLSTLTRRRNMSDRTAIIRSVKSTVISIDNTFEWERFPVGVNWQRVRCTRLSTHHYPKVRGEKVLGVPLLTCL